jgi:CRP-like cAMP-binding protein
MVINQELLEKLEVFKVINQEFFERFEAFKNLTEKQRTILTNLCEEVFFKQDDRLFAEGDPATNLWLVVDGRVDLRFEMPDKRVSTAKQTVSSVEVTPQKPVAKTLGWSCFVPPYKMRLSAYCVTPTCRIVRLPKKELLQYFENDPAMGYRFMSYMVTVVGFRFQQFQDLVAKTTGDTIMSGW